MDSETDMTPQQEHRVNEAERQVLISAVEIIMLTLAFEGDNYSVINFKRERLALRCRLLVAAVNESNWLPENWETPVDLTVLDPQS